MVGVALKDILKVMKYNMVKVRWGYSERGGGISNRPFHGVGLIQMDHFADEQASSCKVSSCLASV